jgi:hypothetical protein
MQHLLKETYDWSRDLELKLNADKKLHQVIFYIQKYHSLSLQNYIRSHFTEQAGSVGNASEMYSGGIPFESL